MAFSLSLCVFYGASDSDPGHRKRCTIYVEMKRTGLRKLKQRNEYRRRAAITALTVASVEMIGSKWLVGRGDLRSASSRRDAILCRHRRGALPVVAIEIGRGQSGLSGANSREICHGGEGVCMISGRNPEKNSRVSRADRKRTVSDSVSPKGTT